MPDIKLDHDLTTMRGGCHLQGETVKMKLKKATWLHRQHWPPCCSFRAAPRQSPVATTVASTSTEYKTTLAPLPGVDYQRFEWPGTDTQVLMPLVDGWRYHSNYDEETDGGEGLLLSNQTGVPERRILTGVIAFNSWEKKYAKDEEQATVQAHQDLARLNDFTLIDK